MAEFEPAGEWQIRHWMRLLSDQGVNDVYESLGFAPHITLSEFLTQDFPRIREQLQSCISSIRPIEIRFASLGIFPGLQGVLHLVPAMNSDLLELHRTIYSVLHPYCQEFSPYYLEKNWVPHCTLVLNMDPLELPAAYSALLNEFRPFTTSLSALEVITCCPFQSVFKQTLPDPPAGLLSEVMKEG